MPDPNQPVTPPVTPDAPVDEAPAAAPPVSLTDAFKSGAYRLPKGKPVPVRLADGKVGTVPAEHAQEVVDSGGDLIDDATFAEAKRHAKYGGVAGAAAAAGEGFARGLTVGISDPLAIGAAGLIGGEQAAAATREHLTGVREEHPILSTGTELLGAAAPLVATGGASAPEEAAALAARGGLEGAELARAAEVGTEAASGIARATEAAKVGAGATGGIVDAARVAGTLARTGEAATTAASTATAASEAASRVAAVAGQVRQGLEAGIRTAGAANRGIAALGEAAAAGSKALFGAGEGSTIGAFSQRLAAQTAKGVVEGGAYGLANEIDESYLGDHELNGEKLLSAVGHGAFLGGALTGGLESLGSLSRSVVGRVAPKLETLAEEQAWKSLSPLKKYTEQANARMPGGTRAVGRVLIDEGVIPESLAGATPEQLAPRIAEAKTRVGTRLSEIMGESGAKVKVNDVVGAVDEIIQPLERKAGFEPIVRALNDYKESLLEKLAPQLTHEGAPETKLVQRLITPDELLNEWVPRAENSGAYAPGWTPGSGLHFKNGSFYTTEIKPVRRLVSASELENEWVPRAGGRDSFTQEWAARNGLEIQNGKVYATERKLIERRANPLRGFTPEFMAQNGLELRGKKMYVAEQKLTGAMKKTFSRPSEVSVQALFEQRKALDDLVYREVQSLDPKMRVAFLRDIRGKLANMEVEAIDSASKAVGKSELGPLGQELKDLRRKYQALSIAEDAAETSTSRMATNRNLSLSDYGSAMMAASAGHIGAAPVAAIFHKVLRERGNSVAAYTLNKLASLASVERAAQHVDQQIERGVAGFLRPGTRADIVRKEAPFATPKEAMKAIAKATVNDGEHAAAIDRAVAEIEPHAPQTALAFRKAALASTAYLASKIPTNARHFNSPTPHVEEPRISDSQAASLMRTIEATHDPVGTVLHNMAKGTLMPEHVDALRVLQPKIYSQIVSTIQDDMAKRKKPVAYEKRKQLSILFRAPLDPTFNPSFIKAMQSNYGKQRQGAPASTAPSISAPKRMLSANIVNQHKLPGT